MRMATPDALPTQYTTPKDIGLRNFLASAPDSQAVQRNAMVHTSIVGACTVCKLAGSVDVPINMNFKTADSLLQGRITKVLCPKCRKETEFRPLTPEELNEDQFFIMRRYYDIYKAEVVAGRPIPEHLKQFIDEYDKRLQHARSKKLPPLPAVKGGAPERKIIIPE